MPAAEFGYRAEGGAEFVHGAAPVTRALMREAGLSLAPRHGTRWSARSGALQPAEPQLPHADRFYRALVAVTEDLPVAEFLATHFAAAQYDELRRWVTRTVEGYDAADPHRFSTLALREEWLARDDGEHGRIREGYGALTAYLETECSKRGATIVSAGSHGDRRGRRPRRCPLRRRNQCRARRRDPGRAAAAAGGDRAAALGARAGRIGRGDIGFGNVVKLLLRFAAPWWADNAGRKMADLSFLLSNAPVPTWWTQYPDPYPVLTGWLAGPKAAAASSLGEGDLIDMGLASLAEVFDLPADHLRASLVASRAIDWGRDPFARGAYSYATPRTRAALSVMSRADRDGILISGEALYAGPNMGTVEAALASGRETAQTILQ